MRIYTSLKEYIAAGRPWNDGVYISAIPDFERCKSAAYVFQGEIYGTRGKRLKQNEYSNHNKKYYEVKTGGIPVHVHRAIAWVYCDGHDKEHNEVDHKDGNKMNNSPTNLRWVSHEENMRAYQMLKRMIPGQCSFFKV